MKSYDVAVIGGGPAGLAAALSAKENGAGKVLIIERDHELGGILNQCIHNGFGLHYFKTELTGPEYAQRFVKDLAGTGIDVALDTMVLEISPERTVHAMSSEGGVQEYQARSVVLAMGCRERTRGAIGIPGRRPAGVLTAGAAQRMMNMEGWMIGRRVVILGSGDIGLIMARRMTLEGAEVLACVELMPYSSGLSRNIVQCLDDFGIPLYLSHTITSIEGEGRVEKVTIAEVDEDRRPIPGTGFDLECDTVLLSVGLIPENELSRNAGIEIDPRTGGPVVWDDMETSIPGVYACGNVVHVHDLVDFVTMEAQKAGKAAAEGSAPVEEPAFTLRAGEGATYTVPQKIRARDRNVEVFFRPRNVYEDKMVVVSDSEGSVARFRRAHLAPGEMEKVILPAKILEKAHGNELTVSIADPES